MAKPANAFTPAIFILGTLSAAIINAPATFAATQKNDGKKLETVYVSATRSETAPLPVATQINIISSEEIRLSGAKLLSEVLRTQAGIQLTDSDGSGARNVTASMRGLSGANNVLVLVDGRKLNNPSLAAPALNTVALKDVERIEIVQGSAGVLYGDQAVGGVINIITRRAAAGEIDGSVGATAGSDNLEDYTASVSQGFENGLSYSLSAQKRNADNYRDNNQSAYENALANVRYDFANGFVFIEGQKIDDKLRLPGAITDLETLIDRRMTNSPDDYSNQKSDIARGGFGFDLNSSWSLLTEYSDRNEESDYYSWGFTSSSMRVKSLTPRLIGEFPTTNGQSIVTVGYDDIKSAYESDNFYSPHNSEQLQQSYYAQVIYPMFQRLTFTTGTRIAQVNDDNHLKALSQDDDLHASELGLSYDFGNDWRIFGRYAESFRFANPDENNIVAKNVIFLDSQTGESFELGAYWVGKAATVSYSLYQMQINDEITYDYSVANNKDSFGANVNLPDSERSGFSLMVDQQLSKELALRFNYTYTDAKVVNGLYDGKYVPFVAKNLGTTSVVFIPVDALSFSLEGSYTGSRYKSNDDTNSSPKLPSLVVFNFAAVYSYKQLEISGRINNLTNELYAGLHAAWGQYPQPERNYNFRVNYSF